MLFQRPVVMPAAPFGGLTLAAPPGVGLLRQREPRPDGVPECGIPGGQRIRHGRVVRDDQNLVAPEHHPKPNTSSGADVPLDSLHYDHPWRCRQRRCTPMAVTIWRYCSSCRLSGTGPDPPHNNQLCYLRALLLRHRQARLWTDAILSGR